MSTDSFDLDAPDELLADRKPNRREMLGRGVNELRMDHRMREEELKIRRAAWYKANGRSSPEIKRLMGVTTAEIQRWRQLVSFKEAVKEFKESIAYHRQMARDVLASRQIEYLQELDKIAMDPDTPIKTKTDLLRDLLNRTDYVPTQRQESKETKGEKQSVIVLSADAAERIARSALECRNERTVDAEVVSRELPERLDG